jgi:D-arabinonate dehydratase
MSQLSVTDLGDIRIVDLKVDIYTIGVDLADFGKSRDIAVIRVITDRGIEGIGYVPEFFHIPTPFSQAFKEILSVIRENVVGLDPMSIEAIWNKLYQRLTRWGRRGLVLQAVSGVDMALWDILGKVSGLPLWRLLGGYREEVPAYANTAHHLPPGELAKKALEYYEGGFRAFKIRGARTEVSFEEATERIKAIRDTLGYDVKLMVDMNGTLDTHQAIEYLRKWERYELYWIEEPVHPDNLEGYKRIRKYTNTLIAAGEQHATITDFKNLIENELVDIVQPDAAICGGISEWLKIWSLATAYGVPVSPHALHPIHAQLVAAKPNTMWVEYFHSDNPLLGTLEHQVFEEPREALYAEKGVLRAPKKPGLGLVLKKGL